MKKFKIKNGLIEGSLEGNNLK